MLKAGTYFIGDLCYVMNDVQWDKLCDQEMFSGEFTLDGIRFANYQTKYGDGCYLTNQGGECPVDSGTIGCINVDNILPAYKEKLDDSGILYTFEHDFNTRAENGQLIFGSVIVDTDPQDEYDDDWDDDYQSGPEDFEEDY